MSEISGFCVWGLSTIFNISTTMSLLLKPWLPLSFVISSEIAHDKTIERLVKLQKKFDEKYLSILKKGFSGDITYFHSFAEEVEKVFQSEAIHFQYLKKRKEQLQEYFNSYNNHLQNITKNLVDQGKKSGNWIGKQKMHINKKFEDQIIKKRKNMKDDNEENHNSKGKWI